MHLTGYSGLRPPLSTDDTDRGNKRGRESFFATVRAENLRGPSGFLDTRFEPPPAAIQNASLPVPSDPAV
jgi:hypothetical protein